MGTSEERLQLPGSADAAEPTLADQWRWFTRAATLVAFLTSPVFFLLLYKREGWGLGWALLATAAAVLLFRGFIDVMSRKVIPWPSLFGADGRLKEEDIVARRRAWYWRRKIRRLSYGVVIIGGIALIIWFYHRQQGDPISVWSSVNPIS